MAVYSHHVRYHEVDAQGYLFISRYLSAGRIETLWRPAPTPRILAMTDVNVDSAAEKSKAAPGRRRRCVTCHDPVAPGQRRDRVAATRS
jgi:hypothetical protein